MTEGQPHQRFKPEKGFSYVELPSGIFTAEGIWFHTSEELLKDLAPEVVEHVGVKTLLQDASRWTRLPVTLTTYLVLLFLVIFPLYQALAAALLFFVLLASMTPSIVLPSTIRVVRFISHPILQGLLYVAVLSYLAGIGHINAVWAGLGSFILLRWGVVEKFLSPIVSRLPGMRSRLMVPDRVLRALVVRLALARGTPTKELQDMESEMVRIMQYRKGKR